MEKIATYKQIVFDIVEEIANMIPEEEHVETQLIADDKRGHYLLSSVGWYPTLSREFSVFVHIDVKPNGKVWIQHDGTDLRIAEWMSEKGIPKSDIVLGFMAPYRRADAVEYAVG